MTLRAMLLAVALACGLPAVVCGQDFAHFLGTKVEATPALTTIRLRADGMMNASYSGTFYELTRRITFSISPVRFAGDGVVDVGQYPVSRLEFNVPRDNATPRINCTLELYQPGRCVLFPGLSDMSASAPTDAPQVLITLSGARNELVIMIVNDRPIEPPRAVRGPLAAPQLAVTGAAGALSLHAIHADIRQVAQALMRQTGAQILLDAEAHRRVSAHFDDCTLEQVLRGLAAGEGLALARDGDAWVLCSMRVGGVQAATVSREYTLPLRFVSPDAALSLLPDVAMTYVRANAAGQALTVTCPPALYEKIARDVAVIDQPAGQVLLRAWVISASDSRERLRQLVAAVSGGEIQVSADSLGAVQLQVGGARAADLLGRLRALTERIDVRVTSVPMMQVASGQSAALFVGQDIYFLRVGSDGLTTELGAVKAGTRLEIAPRTGGEWITGSVKIEDNFWQETNALGPLISLQTLQSTVRLRTGDLLIVGGLHAVSDEQERHRVPGGELFARRYAKDTDREVWIVLQAIAVPIGQAPAGKG